MIAREYKRNKQQVYGAEQEQELAQNVVYQVIEKKWNQKNWLKL